MIDVSPSRYVGRLAPSPTGALHLGNARTFLVAWLRARSVGGRLIMRMEDLDHPRDKPGADVAAYEDLKWLGFDWDETFVQSERREIYADALRKLIDKNLVYPCVCSRKDVESAQSAPHAGEQLHYPGTCRDRFSSWSAAYNLIAPRLPCWRFRIDPGQIVSFDDVFAGHYEQDVGAVMGDFPLARDPDGAGYTLAATVDDCLMGVTEVVRGDDLLPATPQHILIARALGYTPPSYCHLPLVVGENGMRLAKRHGDTRICSYRERGLSPERIIGLLAHWCGLAAAGEQLTLADLLPRFRDTGLGSVPKSPVVWDSRTLGVLS